MRIIEHQKWVEEICDDDRLKGVRLQRTTTTQQQKGWVTEGEKKKKKKNERDFKSVPPNNENYMLSSLDLWRQSSIN